MSAEELLLQALIDLQQQAAFGGTGTTEAHAEVEHLSSLMTPEQVERVRERARKVSSYEKVVERTRQIREQVDQERSEFARSLPQPTPPASPMEIAVLCALLLVLLLVKLFL